MTAPSGGDLVAETLRAHGVQTLFTLCGGHIAPILVGARKAGLRVVDVRDEAAAVFAADATARLTGGVGVAAVTAGPGVTNAVTALQNARMAQTPVLLLGGAAPTVLKGRGALQDIDQLALTKPLVKWAGRARRVSQLVPLVHRAIRRASEGLPGPAFLECPVDLLYPEAVVRDWYAAGTERTARSLRGRLERWYLRRHVDRMFRSTHAGPHEPTAPPVPRPTSRSVARAADLLRRAHRPLLLVGSQTVADAALVEAAGLAVMQLGIPTYLSGMARGLLGRHHPLVFRHGRRDALRTADLVILAGVPCDFRLDYGRHINRSARLVAANRSRADARRNRRPDVAAIGDAGTFLRDLAAAMHESGPWTDWRASLEVRETARDGEIGARARESTTLINPLALLREIDACAGDDATFILDGGDFAATAAYVLSPRGPLRQLDPGVFGTLGVGGGFALGAAVARPGAEIWILYGDGSAAYSLAEFDTFVRHGLAVIAVVGNDASWAQIARDQVALLEDDVGTTLRRSDYHTVARGFGGAGLMVDHPEEVPAVLAEAQRLAAAGTPVLVNALLAPSDFRKGSISM